MSAPGPRFAWEPGGIDWSAPVDWSAVERVLNAVARAAEQFQRWRVVTERQRQVPLTCADDEEMSEAAELLGVTTNATVDQIRAALRAKLSASPLHPDQGGNAEAAKRIIAAKNLLIQAKRRQEQ